MTTGFFRRAAAALAALALATTPLAAAMCDVRDDLELSEADILRLERLAWSRAAGLAWALRSDDAGDREAVSQLIRDGLPQPEPELIAGSYQCRTIKMGELVPLVVYDWFRCEITPEARAFNIRKITGSQNFSGTLFPAGGGYLYRGAMHYGNEGPTFYGRDEERDQVGCLSGGDAGGGAFRAGAARAALRVAA